MWIVFGFIVIGILLYMLALCSIAFEWEMTIPTVFWGTIFFILGLVFMHVVNNVELEQQAKDILIKGNPYEMIIQYELRDSLYVPADTIFVLKQKK